VRISGLKRFMKSWLWVGCAALLLGGCATDRLVGRPGLQVVDGARLPMPDRGDVALQQRREYVIAPTDRLTLDVFGVAELTRTVQVDPNGTFTLPLVGAVQAAGKTPTELAATIADRLRVRYMRNPQVAVNAETINQTVTIEGQVRTPGSYPVLGRTTLLQSLARAQGLTDDANTRYVVVFRRVGNQQMAALYDVRAIRQGAYEDPEIFANDVITVGETQSRRIFGLVFQTVALLTGPLLAIVR
jgi:polysaccharide export outer membrane protein